MKNIPLQENICLDSPPSEIVIADFHDLVNNIPLRTSETNRKLLLMQTIQGHANMAHGKFRKSENRYEDIRYPNATLDDIATALAEDKLLGMKPIEVKKKRMENIMEIRELMIKILKKEKVRNLQNSEGEPLMGIPFFNDIEIRNPKNVLKGFYLGSIMDNYIIWRKQLEKKPYNLSMGGGDCVAVDMRKLNYKSLIKKELKLEDNLAMDLTMKFINGCHLGTLANEEWADCVSFLYGSGVIIDKDSVRSTKNIRNAYVRYKKGKGVSDNAAFTMAGKIYGQKNKQDGIETALGVFLADAIDTYDKYLPKIHKHGLDEIIGQEIENSGKLRMTKKEKLNFIFLSAIQLKEMISNSQRYLLQIDEKSDDTVIENILTYLQGDQPKNMVMGNKYSSSSVKSKDFYKAIEGQFQKYQYLL